MVPLMHQFWARARGVSPLTLISSWELVVMPDMNHTPPKKSDTPVADEFFGPYQILQVISNGATAQMLRARHIHPKYANVTFALKILHSSFSAQPEIVRFFHNEAYILNLLDHPNIIHTFEAGEQENKLFIANEYVLGRDLEQILLRCRRGNVVMPLPLAMYIGGEVLRGLIYAHALCDEDNKPLHLVHRDISPTNILLSFNGEVKIADFGVASMSQGETTGSKIGVAGKVGYFAPEILNGATADKRADLFSLAAVLFELLTGVQLFHGSDAQQTMRLNRQAKIPKLTQFNHAIPPKIEEVLDRALERNPEDRFATGVDLLRELEPFIPASASMKLALGAWFRDLFLPEFKLELALADAMHGQASPLGAGVVIELQTSDSKAQMALWDLFQQQGYHVQLRNPARLQAREGALQTPHIILAEVTNPLLSQQLRNITKGPGAILANTPIIAMCDALTLSQIDLAMQFHASDILFRPFPAERALAAVANTLMHLAELNQAGGTDPFPTHSRIARRTRVLTISQDQDFIAKLTQEFANTEFSMEHAATPDIALQLSEHASCDAIILETTADLNFISQYRKLPGIDVVPFIVVIGSDAAPLRPGECPEHCAIVDRRHSLQGLIKILAQLGPKSPLGRAFRRYECEFPCALHCGGRSFTAMCTDISRGGMRLLCDQSLSADTLINLNFVLPGGAESIEATARVIRRGGMRSPQPTGAAYLNIEFRQFSGHGETTLISYIRQLAQSNVSRQQSIELGG